MIIEAKVTAGLAVSGALGTLVGALMQEPGGNGVLWIAAMSSFVAFCGVLVSGFVSWNGQQTAARERHAQQAEARLTAAKVIDTVEVGNQTIATVEHSVNSAQSELKTELKASRDEVAKALAANAELVKKYELLVASVTRPTSAPSPMSAAPVPVVITDTEKPVDVNMVEKKEP